MTHQFDPNKITPLDDYTTSNEHRTRLEFADKAEALLRRILVALGYVNSNKVTPQDLILSVMAWLTLFTTMKREPGGSYASFWARAFFDAWKTMSSADAARAATSAVDEFAKRYPPMLDDVLVDEHGRDTQSDLEALSLELDTQTKLVWQLDGENKALLKANERHASELAICRIQLEERTAQRDQLIRDVYGALVPLAKPASIEPGQRWAFVDSVHYVRNDAVSESAKRAALRSGEIVPLCDWMQLSKDWIYLGTDKV